MFRSLFNNVAGLQTCNILKSDFNVKFFRTAFLEKNFVGCFWQFYHSTVKSARVFLIWFCAFTCFWTWSKAYATRWTNNSLLSRDKTFYFLLELIYHVLSISEYILEKGIIKPCTHPHSPPPTPTQPKYFPTHPHPPKIMSHPPKKTHTHSK